MEERMHFSGTLLKWTNYFSGWQARWFVLDNGILSYYKSEDDVSSGCKGSVKMSVCDIVVHHSDNTRLDLIIPGEQHFYIKASNAKERQQWLVAMGSTKASTGKDIDDKETELLDLLKSKRSELRLYCDLLMQQIHSVKMAVPQNNVPNLESLNQATSLLSPTCDTFIHTLDECMQLVAASMPYESPSPQSPITDATTPLSPHKHATKKNRQFHRQNSSDRPASSQRSRSSSVTSQDATPTSRQISRHRTASGSDLPLGLTEQSIPEHSLSPSTCRSLSAPSSGSVQSQSKDSNKHSSMYSKSSETGAVDNSNQSENVNNHFSTSPLSQTGRTVDQSQTGLEQNGFSVEDEIVHSDEGDIFLDPIEARVPTFFSEMKPSFADLKFTEDAGIPVEPFLDACKCLVPIFDKLNSTAFAPVKMDFQGNIRKVRTKYSMHPKEFSTLQSIILHEIGTKQQFVASSASMALLWMKRSLEFIVGFLEEVKNGEEDLSVAATNAYSNSLKPYHSWVVRGVFAVAVKALPYRSTFIPLLSPSPETDATSDLFLTTLRLDLDTYTTAVGVVIQVLNDFINLHDLNTQEQI